MKSPTALILWEYKRLTLSLIYVAGCNFDGILRLLRRLYSCSVTHCKRNILLGAVAANRAEAEGPTLACANNPRVRWANSTMGNEASSSHSQTAKNLLWVVVALLLILLILYNLYLGLTVGKIGLPGGLTVEFREKPSQMVPGNSVAQLPNNEREQRQAQLEKQLREMEEKLRNSEQRGQTTQLPQQKVEAPAQQTQLKEFNISGAWRGDEEGISYVIRQNGNAITIQEVNAIYGITAVGQGAITQQDINLSYTTALGTVGRGSLRVSDDGRQITGTFTDQTTGVTMPASLSR